MHRTPVKPFLKWAGGKGQLLERIAPYYPFSESINRYVEPFVGGGAVLCDVLNRYDLEEIHINDLNGALINAYRTIRNQVHALLELLELLEREFISRDTATRAAYYYAKRDEFNALNRTNASGPAPAALLIFLNRTCFNGLYRVNGRGEFNVPVGRYKNPAICQSANLLALAEKFGPCTSARATTGSWPTASTATASSIWTRPTGPCPPAPNSPPTPPAASTTANSGGWPPSSTK